MPVDYSTSSPADLYDLLIHSTDPTVLSAVVLEVMNHRFNGFAPNQQNVFSDAINNLALGGLSAAYPFYNDHLKLNKYSDWFSSETKFKMAGFPDPLMKKVLKDVADQLGVAPKDIADINPDGDVVGIKLESPLRDDWHLKLTALDANDVDRSLPPDQAKGLTITRLMKEGLMTPAWQGWQSTWDDAQKKVTRAKTPEEMGEAFCQQIFLMPFNFAKNWSAKFDAWAINAFKQRQAEKAAAAAAGGTPTPGTPTPGSPTPGSPNPPDIDDDILAMMNERAKMEQIARFKQDYLTTLYKHALTHHDKASENLAKELEAAWKKDYKDEADFEAQNPGLNKKMWANLEKTLVKPENKDLLDTFMAAEFAPPAFKDVIKNKVREQQMKDEANDFRKEAAKLIRKEGKKFTARKAGTITDAKFSLSQTKAGNFFGATIDPRTASITHFEKDATTGCLSSITYYTGEGKAVVIRQTKKGKAQRFILEGLNGPHPTLDGKELLDRPRLAWTAAFGNYDAIYQAAQAHGFTSLRGTLSVKSSTSLFKDAAYKTR